MSRERLGVRPSLPLLGAIQSGAENRTPRRWRECGDSLSQRERAGERESAKNCKELQYAINSTDLRMEAVN